MISKVLKKYELKSRQIVATMTVLLLVSLAAGCTEPQPPLVQLSPEQVNKFIAAGISNIVFYNKDTRIQQILDLKKDTAPQVRVVEPNKIVLESMKVSVEKSDNHIDLMPVAQAKNLVINNVPYIEYRDHKDQTINVFALSKEGKCIKCQMQALIKGYPQQSDLPNKSSKDSILDYVITPVEACIGGCTPCNNPPCKKLNNHCCHC